MIKEELQKAVEELSMISASSVIEENGWNAKVETRYGLVSFWKKYPSFEISQDMGGNKAIYLDGYCLNFRKVSDLSDFYS